MPATTALPRALPTSHKSLPTGEDDNGDADDDEDENEDEDGNI
jgi:hypothetical protein